MLVSNTEEKPKYINLANLSNLSLKKINDVLKTIEEDQDRDDHDFFIIMTKYQWYCLNNKIREVNSNKLLAFSKFWNSKYVKNDSLTVEVKLL